MTRYEATKSALRKEPRSWLVTGVAGFIGSHLLEQLLRLDQTVVGLDDFSTGRRRNLEEVRSLVSPGQWSRFRFIEGDVCNQEDCRRACQGADYVLHQAALGSVPHSIEHPEHFHVRNVDGFFNLLTAARAAAVKCFAYASSSSVYGDTPVLPQDEGRPGRPLSPYAATKLVNEIYAGVFQHCYGLPVVGLRYFNIFGPRQDPGDAYARVISKWFSMFQQGGPVYIYGDGETSRDFCFVGNAVQANLLAATTRQEEAVNPVYNVACGQRTTLRALFEKIRGLVGAVRPEVLGFEPVFRPERAGDMRHSLADLRLARERLGYEPTHSIDQGLLETSAWYLDRMAGSV